MKKPRFLTLLFCALLSVVLLAGCSGKEESPVPPEQPVQNTDGGNSSAGTAAELGCLKSFSAGTLGGGSFTQDDITEKDLTIINFWSLTCGPCIAEMPDLAAFAKALPDNVQLVTVCLDGAGNEERTAEILEEAGFEGITIISGDGDLLSLAGNLIYTPTTLLADSEGNLVSDAIIGRQEDLSATFLAAVNAALESGGKEEIRLDE